MMQQPAAAAGVVPPQTMPSDQQAQQQQYQQPAPQQQWMMMPQQQQPVAPSAGWTQQAVPRPTQQGQVQVQAQQQYAAGQNAGEIRSLWIGDLQPWMDENYLISIFSHTGESMDTQFETLEEKLKALLGQLQVECGVFERIVYKNKNQHRRCSYFQYLLKVRRDLRLLQSANLEELLGSCFHVITGRKPRHKVYLLESLNWKKSDGRKPNFMERLLGAARLLSQMVEPMLKAASEVCTLLARSFFMGFSLTVLALLARLRVLVQQILLDIVLVFNTVSSISQKKQSIKIMQEGIEVYRDFYPKNEEPVSIECVWKTDKFVLLEKTNKSEIRRQEEDVGGDALKGDSSVLYQRVESFLGDEELGSNKVDIDVTAEEGPTYIKEEKIDLSAGPSVQTDKQEVEGCDRVEDGSGVAGRPSQNLCPEGALPGESSSPRSSSGPQKLKLGAKKVAFVSAKRPVPSSATVTDTPSKKPANSDTAEDRFYNLLTGGNFQGSLF